MNQDIVRVVLIRHNDCRTYSFRAFSGDVRTIENYVRLWVAAQIRSGHCHEETRVIVVPPENLSFTIKAILTDDIENDAEAPPILRLSIEDHEWLRQLRVDPEGL